MAFRRALAKRIFNNATNKDTPPPPLLTLEHSLISGPSKNLTVPSNAAKTSFQREFLTSPDSDKTGFFRRFLQRRGINQSASKLPEFLYIPVGDRLREKLRSLNVSIAGDRIRLDGLTPPVKPVAAEKEEEEKEMFGGGVSVEDVKKILRTWQLEKVKAKLREMPMNSISYGEYVRFCSEVCESREQGEEFAKMLDQSGNVVVLGNIVFLRPDQVAKSVEKLIAQSIALPNDPRRNQLEQMEKQKAIIDRKAISLVRAELYCGLGVLVLQTLGFMRLTFWELSWDVMEPICFFVTSLHFALAYGFFLRTSKEPSFEGYFQRRFKVKQRKLMKTNKFDIEKYNELSRAFYPTSYSKAEGGGDAESDHARGPIFSSMQG